MNRIYIPPVIALIVGVVLAVWGRSFQKPIDQQSDGGFILSTGLMVGGVLIAVAACFALGRASANRPAK